MMKCRRTVALLMMVTLFCAGCGGSDSAMRLTKTEGTVEVLNGNGETISPAENVELSNGCRMETGEESHAWIALDGVKTVKLDKESGIEVQKDGEKTEVIVSSGGVFFNVTKPVKEEETFVIRTSTMMVDIQEGCGWVEVLDDTHENVFVLTGSVECGMTNPKTGEVKTEQISSREKAELNFYSRRESGKYDMAKDKLELYEVPSYVLEEVWADNGLRRKINAAVDIQIPKEGSAQAYALRGMARISDGETEENMEQARADYEKALELDAANAGGYLGLADLEIRQGEYDAAMETLENALEETGDSTEIKEKIAEMESGEIKDSQQRMRRYSLYRDGELAWYHDYFYDEQGRRIKITAYDASEKQLGTGEEKYDEEGRKIQAYGWETQTGKLMKETYEFDENGNRVRKKVYDTEGMFIYYCENEYDEKGLLVKSSQYEVGGYLDVYYTYEYDKNGNQIRKNHYSEDGTLISYHLYEYDEKGYCVRDRSYRGTGELRWDITYEYDEEGNRISEQRVIGEE